MPRKSHGGRFAKRGKDNFTLGSWSEQGKFYSPEKAAPYKEPPKRWIPEEWREKPADSKE